MAKKNSYSAGGGTARGGIGMPIFIVILAVLCLGSFITVKLIREHRAKELATHSKYYCDAAFSAEGMEAYQDIKYYADGLLVFTGENNVKGLMNLEGDPITQPIYSDFSVMRYDGWNNVVYTATPLGEAFPKTVIVAEQRVDVKQYESTEQEGAFACWDETSNALVWHDKKGVNTPVSYGELGLDDGLYAVPNSTKSAYGYIDANLNLVVPVQYEMALDFDGGMGAVKKDGKWGYINENGELTVACCFDSVKEFTVEGADYSFGFCQGLAPVMAEGKMGLVDKEGKTVADFAYSVILPGENGKFVAKKDGKWGVLTLVGVPEGETVSHTNPKGVSTAGRDTYRVVTGGSPLNLREDKSSSSAALAQIPNGTRINVTQTADGWAYTSYGSASGWVSLQYLEKVEETTEEIASDY